jgi:phytoene dehydrogenase-like protein
MRRELTTFAGAQTAPALLRCAGPGRRSRPRVVIAGAGPGGLAAAMLLAKAGADVTVLERKDRVGGRSATLHAGGFRFDLGPTFFLYPQVLAEIFAACGHRLEREVELIRLDPIYHLMFEGGGEIRASADLATLAEDIARLSPEDAAAVPRYIGDNRAKFEAFRPVLQRPFAGWRDLVTPDLLRALPVLRPFRSVDGDLARYFSDPRVRLAFSFQSKYLGMSPFKCPSLFTILSLMEYEHVTPQRLPWPSSPLLGGPAPVALESPWNHEGGFGARASEGQTDSPSPNSKSFQVTLRSHAQSFEACEKGRRRDS